jgi:hypothetical protein
MEMWKEYVQGVAKAMGTTAVYIPDLDAMVMVAENPIHVRMDPDGKTLVIEARLLPVFFEIPSGGSTMDELAKISGQIARSIRPDAKCQTEADGKKIIASLTAPFKVDEDGVRVFAQCIADLNHVQKVMADFLAGEMSEEATVQT